MCHSGSPGPELEQLQGIIMTRGFRISSSVSIGRVWHKHKAIQPITLIKCTSFCGNVRERQTYVLELIEFHMLQLHHGSECGMQNTIIKRCPSVYKTKHIVKQCRGLCFVSQDLICNSSLTKHDLMLSYSNWSNFTGCSGTQIALSWVCLRMQLFTSRIRKKIWNRNSVDQEKTVWLLKTVNC